MIDRKFLLLGIMQKFLPAALFFSLLSATAFASDMEIGGVWWTQAKDAKVEITDCGDGTPCGRLIWTEDGNPLDANNPDPELRDKPLIGAKMFWGFKRSGKKWKSGKIYDARSGKTYKSKLKLRSNGKLDVSGCVAFFCDGETWTRVEN